MARVMTPYPPDHSLALARVLRVVEILVARPDILDEEVEAQLVAEGVGPTDAKLLVLYVPSALTFPLLTRMAIKSYFSFFIVRDVSGRVVHLPWAGEHYYTAALTWVEGYFSLHPAERPLSTDQYHSVAGRSAEMDCVNNMIAQGGPDAMRGAVVGPTVLCGVTIEQITASRPKPAPRRPWWRFWGERLSPVHE